MTGTIKILESQRPFWKNLQNLIEYRELLFSWTVREIRARYRQSALGFGWALIQPLFQMIVLSIIFGNILNVPSDNVPYPVFAYVAILPWSFFSGAISTAIPSILNSMDLVTKIYFPREILPMSAILARLVDFMVASLVFIGLIWYYNMPIHYTWLLVPLLILIQLVLSFGIGLFGAAISVFLRDISFAVPLGMQIWMYLTPVIYPLSEVPEQWRSVYYLNPMVALIEAYRKIILDGSLPDFGSLSYSIAFSMILAITSYLYFKRLEMAMSDII